MSKLFIGPYESGLQRDKEPWLLPNEAFPTLEDAYVWRGRVKKKEGYGFIGRLHRLGGKIPDLIGATIGPGAVFAGNINAAYLPLSPGTVEITVGALVFTDYQVAASGRPNPHYDGVGTLSTNVVNANYGTIDYLTGAITLNFDPAIGGAVNVWLTGALTTPRLPVMGMGVYEHAAINQEELVVFDEDYSYDYNTGTGWFRDVSFYANAGVQNAVVWTGSDSDFFWTTNYYDVLWETNNVEGNHGLAITNITVAAAAVITVGIGHGFIVGDVVFINEVTGMVEINGLTGTVTAIGLVTITINIDSLLFTPYVAGGVAFALTRTLFGDGIRFYNGFGGGVGWRNFEPPVQSTAVPEYLMGALIVLPFKDRMIALNTVERAFLGGGGAHPQRARWSQNGTPFYAENNVYAAGVPNPGYSWTEDVGRGGYIDAPTNEAIVSAAYIKDSLIVFFERSTWQLRYTGNEVLPFIWERINEELGAESTFSPVQFDKGVLAVGDKAIITSNSIGVERIDQRIPDEVFNFHNDNQGATRVHGIRDFYKKMVYWTFPNDDPNETYPDRILALNYDEGSYSIFKNSFTCFGTMQFAIDYTWATLPYASWADWNIPWSSPVGQSYFPEIIAGNQVGFVLNLSTDRVENSISMDLVITIAIPDSITNGTPPICQVINHNLHTGQFVKITNTTGFGVNVVAEDEGTSLTGATAFTGTLTNLGVFPSTIVVTIGANVFTDLGDGTLAGGTGGSTIEYETGIFTVNFAALVADTPVTATYTYNILNFRNFYVTRLSADTFSLWDVAADGLITGVPLAGFGAAYQGSGQITVVDNFNIITKRFSPFIQEDDMFRMSHFDAFLQTTAGDFVVNIFGDQDDTTSLTLLQGSSEDYSGRNSQKHWTRFFSNLNSDFAQIQFTMTEHQMTITSNPASDFQLHAMNLDIQSSGRL
ncbi:MAG: ubiquitin-activating E1 FCCH domain-containing protein [Candidatus Heimdallarchaeaceae archaeon]